MSKIKEIIIESLKESESSYIKDNLSSQTHIFGDEGRLDSLGLVTFLVTVEQKIEDEYTVNLTIADEKAMSQKNSPFKTIGSLTEYLENIIEKK